MTRFSYVAAGTLAVICGFSLQAHAAGVPKTVAAAVADPARPQADKDRDANRHPAEVVAFSGVKAGDKVVDLLPGTGYFTRIFSVAVGPKGKVYSVPQPKRPNAKEGSPDPAAGVNAIAADAHYGNVTVITANVNELTLPDPVDIIWTSDNYHDLHNAPGDIIPAFNKTMFGLLKPGGTFIVLDYSTAPGAGIGETKKLHRVDPEAVKKEVEAAGFVYESSSNAVKNKDDTHTAPIFDPSIRGKADQFVLKFKKPKK